MSLALVAAEQRVTTMPAKKSKVTFGRAVSASPSSTSMPALRAAGLAQLVRR